MGRYTSGSVARDVVGGAVAGIAAIWLADKLDQAMYRRGGPASIRKTEAARPGGMDPAHVLAKRAADAVGVEVANPRDNLGGHTIHYGLAAGFGALYGLMRGIVPGISAGRGALFGIGLFILKDEIGNTALRTAGHPLSYPLRDHARGAAAHVAFGILTDVAMRVIAPWRDLVVIEQGPPLSERLDQGRAAVAQQRDALVERGRRSLDQGIVYAGQLAERTRARLPETDVAASVREGRSAARSLARQAADAVRSRLPDARDVSDLADAGAQQARRTAQDMRARLASLQASDTAKSGRRMASDLGDTVRDQTSGLSRAFQRIFA